MSERTVRIGGLMRCCLQSIAEYNGAEVPGKTVIGCKYHEDKEEAQARIADDGVWEWVGLSPKKRIEVPLVHTGEPGTVTSEQVKAFLDPSEQGTKTAEQCYDIASHIKRTENLTPNECMLVAAALIRQAGR